MNQSLPFFNWSIAKTLAAEPDSFTQARIKIVYTLLLFALLKSVIVIGIAGANGQGFQLSRAIIVLVVYALLLKLLLSRPAQLKLLSSVMIVTGILIIWTNILFYTHGINLLTIQFVFMIVLSSFYTLGSVQGFVFSTGSVLPVVLFLLFKGHAALHFDNTPQELAAPGPWIIATLNFLSIIMAHYLFYEAFHTNLKEKEKLNNRLQLAIVEANKLAESRSNFLSTMSHELRTPLNAVIGMSELLLDASTEPAQRKNLKILQSSSWDLLSLINNVLDFNKTDADKVVLESVPFYLGELVEEKCAGLRLKMTDKQLNFALHIDPQLERTVVVSDPVRLSQVIYNLLSNAIRFTDKGSISMRLDCIGRSAQQADVLFSISDTGIGIHPDKHQSIFEIFTQAGIDTTRNYGGTGLGLAIVRRILHLFGSTIQLESSPGQGSRFFFTLSFTVAEEAAPAPKTILPSEVADISHLSVLVAEDNQVNRVILKKQMEKLKLAPVIVENGQQAYEAYASGDYDVVFLDLQMPVLDGYGTIRQIRALEQSGKASVPIIAFTASTTEQQKIRDAGFDDFLHKPATISDLHHKLEEIALLRGTPLQKKRDYCQSPGTGL